MELMGLSGLQVLLAVGDLLEVSPLGVVLVASRDRGGRSLDLLHLLQVQLEGMLLHLYVCQLSPSLRVEHSQEQ